MNSGAWRSPIPVMPIVDYVNADQATGRKKGADGWINSNK